MKILVVSGKEADGIRVEAGADSAILRHAEPVFLPEDASAWQSFVVPSVRMSRLGTHIPCGKARSYYDSFSLFHVLKPDEDTGGIPWPVCDRTFSPGSFMEIPDKAIDIDICLYSLSTRNPLPETHVAGRLDFPAMDIDRIVSHISRYCTFKTGDLLLLSDYSIGLGRPKADTGLRVETGTDKCLDIRLK